MSTLTIGQVAERTGFTPAALRYYDDRGLVVPSSRSEGGYRLYDAETLERLAFIGRAKQLGCSLDEIADLLDVWDGQQCGPVQTRFHELITDKIRATQSQIAEWLAFAARLKAAARRLSTIPVDEACSDTCACLADDVGETVAVELATASAAPIACTLEPGAMPDRLADWTRILDVARARSCTSDGRLRIEFRDGIDVAELIRLVEAEQRCCAFFAFAVTIDERGIALEVAAPADASDVLTGLFGAAA